MLKQHQNGRVFAILFGSDFPGRFALYIIQDLELSPAFLGIGEESTVFSQEPQKGSCNSIHLNITNAHATTLYTQS